MSAETETEHADRGCEFFFPPSNELVLRKAALVELEERDGKRESEREREREREREKERERERKKRRGATYSYVASLGLIIKKCKDSCKRRLSVIKERSI